MDNVHRGGRVRLTRRETRSAQKIRPGAWRAPPSWRTSVMCMVACLLLREPEGTAASCAALREAMWRRAWRISLQLEFGPGHEQQLPDGVIFVLQLLREVRPPMCV